MRHRKTPEELNQDGGLSMFKEGMIVVGSLEASKITIDDPDKVEQVIAEAVALYRRKSQNYGQAWRSQGWAGNVARVLSKATRIKNMLWRETPQTDQDETVEDTLLDLINLCAFTIINLREQNRWGK